MANSGDTDSEKSNPADASQEQEPDLGAPMPGEDANSKPLASSLGQAAKTFESKFAARRKKRLEETAAALSSGSKPSAEPAAASGSGTSGASAMPGDSGSSGNAGSSGNSGSSEKVETDTSTASDSESRKFESEGSVEPREANAGEGSGSSSAADDGGSWKNTGLSGSEGSTSSSGMGTVSGAGSASGAGISRFGRLRDAAAPDSSEQSADAAGMSSGDSGAEPVDSGLDDRAKSFLAKLTDNLSTDAAKKLGDDPESKSALGEEFDFKKATRMGAQDAGDSGSSGGSSSASSASTPEPAPAEKPAPPERGGFKPRKDLSSYRSLESRREASGALAGPGGSADAKLFGGKASAPEDLPPDEPQTPEERKKALDAIGYKFGTELPKEVTGGPVVSAKPATNDQFIPPPPKPAPAAPGSDVGWQSVDNDDEPRPKTAAFVSAKKSSPVLSAVEVAARRKEEQDPRINPHADKAKPFRGREDDGHVPKNRWGQTPDTATARSIWADQLGIAKPSSALRGPSASLRGRLKRVMSSDIFNVRELYSLRGVAAILVFLAQAQLFAAHGKVQYPINVIGAQIFFVMSGFVITRWLLVNESGSLQRTLGEFYARRALRIFPMYYLVLCVLLFTGHLPYYESFFCGLFNLKAYEEAAKVPPQLMQYWTLCVEIQFYLAFPLLLMITPQRLRMALVILLTAAATGYTYMSTQSTPNAQDWLMLPISGQYLMWGCLAAYMDVKSDIALSLDASMCVILGLLSQLGLHAWLLVYGKIDPNAVADILWKSLSTVNAISLSVLIFGLWRTSNAWLRGLCANDVLVYFGKISYGFYLLLPLCFFMQPSIIAVMPILTKVPAIVTSFVITFVMAVVTFHYLQVPLNNVREHLPIAR